LLVAVAQAALFMQQPREAVAVVAVLLRLPLLLHLERLTQLL
jgi:hypothetical protein